MLQTIRRKIRYKVLKHRKEPSPDLLSEIQARRDKLRSQIDKWRDSQKIVMFQVGDHVLRQSIQGCTTNTPEEEILYIPSSFEEDERISLDLIVLGEYERRILEGAACDVIRHLRTISKTLDAMIAGKKKHAYGQARHTKATSQIEDAKAWQQEAIDDYLSIRKSLITLGMTEKDPRFPPLSVDDTKRLSTYSKRAVGDSRRLDGKIWTANAGVTSGARLPASAATGGPSLSSEQGPVATQSSRIKRKLGYRCQWIYATILSPGKAETIGKNAPKGKQRKLENPTPTGLSFPHSFAFSLPNIPLRLAR